MKTKAVSVEKVKTVFYLPDGEYTGVWGGYEVVVTIVGTTYHIKTEEGIRTPSAPCVVHVENGVITVTG